MQVAMSFPKEWMIISEKQKKLESNGCVFKGQERLDSHEIDASKPCYCGRQNKNKTN